MIDTTLLYEQFLSSTGVSIDTRTIQEGNLFFAIRGDRFDGHKFIQAAFDQGAVGAVVQDASYAAYPNTYLVENSIKCLQNLATFHRGTFSIPVLGITGSNGKTTTKELIAGVLQSKFKTHFTQGNLNNHLGVPLTLLSMPVDTEIAIVEMGANHVGEIDLLCNIADPNHGLITNIGKAHIGEFGSFEHIIQGKHELFNYVMSREGTLFVNAEDPYINNDIINEWPKSVFYTKHSIISSVADTVLKLQFDSAELRTELNINSETESHRVESALYGTYNQLNIAAAIACGHYWSVPTPDVVHAIEQYIPTNKRSQVITRGSTTILMDAYNANPDSMRAAVKELVKLPQQKKIAIIGDMLELGPYSDYEHEELLKWILDQEIDEIFVIGNLFPRLAGCTYFPDWESMSAEVDLSNYRESTILVKGSRRLALEKLFTEFQ